MRELRVVGVDAGGSRVICQDPETGEKFTLPSDERLRAAARGDLSRLGQIEIELSSALRPREIQARIRAGATVAEVAELAGVGLDRIERFAHPVLLERARATELAALSHPIRIDGPSEQTLGDAVAEGLIALGHNPNDTTWDAWKCEDGFWAVQVSWHVGHTEHRAHWRYQPGSHGGTTDPLDDLAEELSHPELIETRRRLVPVASPLMFDEPEEPVVVANPPHSGPRSAPDTRSDIVDVEYVEIGARPARPTAETPRAPAAEPPVAPPPPEEPAGNAEPPVDEPQADRAGPADPAADGTDPDGHGPTPIHPRRRKNGKPVVPAWEDVLLGVRSHPNT
ncbi:MAG: septation protein SepH [Gordonia sp. (in: high G+C Gram-positive bacteria)]